MPPHLALLLLALASLGERLAAVALVALEAVYGETGPERCEVWEVTVHSKRQAEHDGSSSSITWGQEVRHRLQPTQWLQAGALVAEALALAVEQHPRRLLVRWADLAPARIGGRVCQLPAGICCSSIDM